MLNIQQLDVGYGPIDAVKSVSLELKTGHIGALMGANGAGKSSLLSAISGLVPTRAGSIEVNGTDISNMPAHQRPSKGIGHVLEGHRVFNDQSVERNLLLGGLSRLNKRREKRQVLEDIEREYERFPVLGERRNQPAGTLSGGEQQMLAMSTALMAKPTLLLIDEPSLGLAPRIVDHVFESIEALKSAGITILLVEQTVELALSVADFGWVMQHGSIVLSGTGEELRNTPSLGAAYLG